MSRRLAFERRRLLVEARLQRIHVDKRRKRLVLAGVYAVLIALAVGIPIAIKSSPSPSPPVHPVPAVRAVGFRGHVIYHSPQSPGYTSWVAAWTMPDGSLMTAFTQATGPVDPTRRPLAPASVLTTLGEPTLPKARDFWGLKHAELYLRSTNGGSTWKLARTEPFKAVDPSLTGAAVVALSDGTLIRRVNGDELRFDPSVPHTAYLQRLEPNATTWTGQQTLMDPSRFTYNITRIRSLPDGRLIAIGGYWNSPASANPSTRKNQTDALWVSSDGGRTWKSALTIANSVGYLPGDEWDAAELPNGDLRAVFRTVESPTVRKEILKTGVLKKQGSGWTLTSVTDAPWPETGHPELLATREGPILYVSRSGIDYTRDGGQTWTPLKGSQPTEYYPRAVQTADGVVHVWSHQGNDDPYGAVDQYIAEQDFRLVPIPGK